MRLVLCIAVFVCWFPACLTKKPDSEASAPKDNQLKRFLQNPDVYLNYNLELDTVVKGAFFFSSAVDSTARRTYPYPGFVILDGTLLTFQSVGGSIQSDINSDPYKMEGDHELVFLFTDDMNYNWGKEEVTSRNRDSLKLKFAAAFYQVNKAVTITGDSVVFQLDKPLSGYVAYLRLIPYKKDKTPDADPAISLGPLQVKNGRIAVSKSKLKPDDSNEFFVNFYISKEYPLYFNGRKKGFFRYTFRNQPFRFRLRG